MSILNHIMNTIHTSQKMKIGNCQNKELRELSLKISSSNEAIANILKSLEPAGDISRSIARDLGIELGKHAKIK